MDNNDFDNSLLKEELMSKDDLDRIINEPDNIMPRLKESLFVPYVLPLLKQPFGKEFLKRYVEVTGCTPRDGLIITDENDIELFKVPPLVVLPPTSVSRNAGSRAVNAAGIIEHIQHECERHSDGYKLVPSMMSQIIPPPDLANKVLIPLLKVLDRYDEKMTVNIRGDIYNIGYNDLMTGHLIKQEEDVPATVVKSSAFDDDDYVD